MGQWSGGSTTVGSTESPQTSGLQSGIVNYLQGGTGGPGGNGIPTRPPVLTDQQAASIPMGMGKKIQQQQQAAASQWDQQYSGMQGGQNPNASQGTGQFSGGGSSPYNVLPGFGGGSPPVIQAPSGGMMDQAAIAADPSGYAQWQKGAAAAGYNSAGMPSGGTSTVGNNPVGGIPEYGGGAPQAVGAQTGSNFGQNQQSNSPYSRINANQQTSQAAQAGVGYSNAPTQVPYVGNSTPVNVQSANPVATPDRSSIRDVTQDPNANTLYNTLFGSMTGQTPSTNPQAQGAQANAGDFGPSVDQMGGANSAFFNNMVGQLQPSFNQNRTDAIAQAKEGLGNLTGSSAGNSLGTAINRSLGDEQAQLANYATQGIQTQAGINTAQGNAGTNANIASANNLTNASQTNATVGQQNYSSQLNGLQNLLGIGQQGQIANQGADTNYQQLLGQLGTSNMQNQQNANNLQANTTLQQLLQNQSLGQGALNQGSSQGLQNSQFNAGAYNNNQQFNAGAQTQNNQFNAAQGNQLNAGNAQNFLQMLMQMANGNTYGTYTQQNPSVLGSILSAGTQLGAAKLGAG